MPPATSVPEFGKGYIAASLRFAVPCFLFGFYVLDAGVSDNDYDSILVVVLCAATIGFLLGIAAELLPVHPKFSLQGEWEFVSMQKPEDSSPFFDFQASSDQQSASVITISGTQLKLVNQVLAELSHYRSGSRQGAALLLDPDGKKRHCHGWYKSEGGPSPEYEPNAAPAPELLLVEVSELMNNLDATQATKQIYEFRRVKKK